MTCRSALGLLVALLISAPTVRAHGDVELAAGFQASEVGSLWNQPVDMSFLPDGRLLVAEKAGLIWIVDGGVKLTPAVVDITEEVADYSSHGLKSFAIDPNFDVNGRIYLLYEVDRHYLFFFGTPQYDPLTNDPSGPTIGRITRFTLDAADNRESVLGGSRQVLLGESVSTGFPILEVHETGALGFGEDGSLLASSGDGSAGVVDTGGTATSAQAISEGFIDPAHDVGALRCQQIDTLSGKLVRLDPLTGDGLPGNPFFDAGSPRSARSRVWSYGLRNPFRFTVIPGTSTGPNHPGQLIIGDVGYGLWEELNSSLTGGENFGWPLYEGMDPLNLYNGLGVANPLAPNPLFGQIISGLGLCTQEFFSFEEMLLQESDNPLNWPNPCDPDQSIPANLQPAMHTRPAIDWGHLGPARAKSFDLAGDPIHIDIGAAGSPVSGPQFDGACVIAGAWYTSGNYPVQYENCLFTADHTRDWIKLVKFDSFGQPIEVQDFGTGIDGLVSLAIDPTDGDLYYLQISGELHHLEYQGGNLSPTARATALPRYGPGPHRVQLDSNLSKDPEEQPLKFTWDFGDGTPTSTLAAPVHIFPSADTTAGGTVTAQVLNLVPPQQMTGAGLFPSVISDGVFVNPSTGTLIQNYLTFPSGTVDTDPNDWVGYEYATDQNFHQLIFQEGMEFIQGGWFDSLTVQVRVANVWTEVSGLEIFPPYTPNDGEPWETYELLFDPMLGDGIRLFGLGGGSENFVSVGELRVITDPGVSASTRYDVSLTVRDSVNQVDLVTAPVWINNTPPSVAITSPVNGSTFEPLTTTAITLNSISSDLESSGAELSCEWSINLHHNNHTHPEPLVNTCNSAVLLAPHASVNSIFFWEITLTVSGPLGLSSSTTSMLYSRPPTFVADEYTLSLFEGGTATYDIDEGPASAGHFYWVLMSASGIWPGIDFGGGAILPLNFDQLMMVTISKPNLQVFSQFFGVLDINGTSSPAFTIPPGTDSSLAGGVINLAYVGSSILGIVEYTSNPVQLTFRQ